MATPDNRRGFIIAVVLIAIGAFFLIVELFNIRLGDDWWPLFFLLPGLALLGVAFSGRHANPGIAVAGAIITTLGGIFIFQNASGNWESWAYIWALFPLATGLALMAAGSRNGDQPMVRSGMETARWAGIVFVIGLLFFELLIFGGLGGYLVPVVLIGIGAYMIWQNSQRNRDGIPPVAPFGASPGTTPPPMPPVPPVPPSPRARPWETESTPPTPSVIVPPPPAAPTAASTPPVIVTPPPARSAIDVAAEPFPADDLPPDPSVPVPTAPFPVDEGSEAIIEAAKKKTRTPRPRTPKPPVT